MHDDTLVLANADIKQIEVAPPPGHQHLRTTITLQDGRKIVLQEATIANLVRAYVAIKTHPQRQAVRLGGKELALEERKEGFAGWQLLEEE